MLDFLGVTEHFSCIENTPFSFPALFRDMEGDAVSLDGVIFSGSIVSANNEVVEISMEKGEASNEVILSFPALPEGRWSYNVLVQADDGSQRILFSGYISVLGISRAEQLAGDAPMKNRTLLVAMPGEAATRLRMEWMATTATQAFAAHALQSSKAAHTYADTASDSAATATGAATTAAERAREAEGYAGAAQASKVAAGNSAASASTSAADAARDARSANEAKTAVEGIVSDFTQTVSNGEQTISAAKEEAVIVIQAKQADSVLAVGRAQKTATDKVASAQGAAVTAVETAKTEAVQAVQTAQAEAMEAITPLVEQAETAKEEVDQAEGRIKTAETNAETSATSAITAATAAQQALAAIPQVDAAGNMTLAGGLTTAGTHNANGGINIPLAAGAPTDMMAVNRLYAAGMAGVTNIYTQRTYLDTGSITATGAAASTAIIPGQYAKTIIPANTHSTVVHNFIGPVGQWNYSSFAGLSVPWQISAAGKFAIGIGRGNKTVRKDLTLDSYSIIPGNDLAYNTGEILDITFTNVRDTTRSGYEIRVREIYCTESTQRWKVKTTTSFIPASGNEPIPYIVNKIIYQQYAPRSYIAGDYGDAYGALYLLTGGGSNQQLWKIATVRGVTTFETGPGFSSIVSDVLGVSGGSVGLFVGTAERTNYQPGNINPVYYALEAITSNAIETESTADFVDINEPFKS